VKTVWASFGQFARAIWQDAMLAVCLFAPILMAVLFRYGVPALETVLCGALGTPQVLAPYYGLLDLLVSMMTPLMLCFAGVMVVFEELDDGAAKYLMVTPLGKAGYLFSRLGVLTALSVVYGTALVALFRLSELPLGLAALSAVCNALVSLSVAMLVVGFAKNKVECMALTKLSGFFMLGYFAAYLLDRPASYLSGWLPSYWLGLMALDRNALWAIPATFTACGWITLLYRRFARRVFS